MSKSPGDRSLSFRILAVAGLLLASGGLAAAGMAATGSDPNPTGPTTPPRHGAAEPPSERVSESPTEVPARRNRLQAPRPGIEWRESVSVGNHAAGSLKRGVRLPAYGRGWFTWDPILKRSPNRAWRRWGSDRMIRATLTALREFRRANPAAPGVAIGDLSRPRGGDFGPQFGSIGHASHQNGLDIDVYYPRKDRRPRPPDSADQVNLKLAQDLVDRFVAAGAELVFVGPSLGLTGPPGVVVPLANHDNHLHARIPLDSREAGGLPPA